MAYKDIEFIVPEPLRIDVLDLVGNHNDKTKKWLCKLIVSTMVRLQQGKSDYVPTPSRALRDIPWYELEGHHRFGMLRINRYDRPNRRCREMKFNYLHEFLRRMTEYYSDDKKYPLVDLVTGKEKINIYKHQRKDSKGVTEPELIRRAFNTFIPRQYNATAITEYMQELFSEYENGDKSKTRYDPLNEYVKALMTWQTIQNQCPVQIDDHIWEYRQAYKSQTSGRISEIGGGLQNAPRMIKQLSIQGMGNVYNYDLRSSQIAILLQEFERLRFNTDWLNGYLANPNSKHECARGLGINVDTWKECLMSLINGGSTRMYESIYNLLFEENKYSDDAFELAKQKLDLFIMLVEPLNKELRRWHWYLVNRYYLSEVGYTYAGKRYVRNATDKRLCIDDITKNKGGKLAAFVLQGQEAAFIHNLTILSDRYGYSVMSNEHDGIITAGKVPDEAVLEASRLSGYKNPELVIKDFI